ncbi:YaiO family outer membrane beta-barrel protein [Maribacter sp. 2210JD10-5]|uniref:YaiO family outer membrane beta-barrel protein n=1 Tax=Maribacter sp. 2210JD10-5 TaxID=3386272 RepID=UPI0039BC3BD9
MKPFKIILLAFFLLPLFNKAQEIAYNGNPDTSYLTARDLAFNGKRSIARDTLTNILTKYPNYADVRSLLASTYSWDGKYEKARGHFNRILSADKENKEVWIAAIKNELYAKKNDLALGLSNKALLYLQNDTDIQELRATALANIKKENESPSAAEKAKESVETKSLQNSINFRNSIDVFDIVFNPMIYSSIGYGRKTEYGTIIGRVNYSNRFETNGIQYEVDLYPKISKTFYAYLNYGYSDATIYPGHRAGAELYANLPKAKEASLGMRYLNFSGTNVAILTGSFGLYKGNYYFSLRPYITPQPTGNWGASGALLVRKYFKDGDNYLGLDAGMGYSAELNQFIVDGELLSETQLFLESQRLRLEYQFSNKKGNNVYNTNLGVNRQELAFSSGNFFWAISAGLSYEIRL